MTFLETLVESRKRSIASVAERLVEIRAAKSAAKSLRAIRELGQLEKLALVREKRLKDELAAFQDELGTYGPGGVNEAKKAK